MYNIYLRLRRWSASEQRTLVGSVFLVIRSKPNSPVFHDLWALHRSHGNKNMIDVITKFLASLFSNYPLNHLLSNPNLNARADKTKSLEISFTQHTSIWTHAHSLVSVLYSQDSYGQGPKTQGFQCRGCKLHHSRQVILIESHTDWPALVFSVESQPTADKPLR